MRILGAASLCHDQLVRSRETGVVPLWCPSSQERRVSIAREMLGWFGDQASIRAPVMVIGIARTEQGVAEVGIIKHNFPPSEKMFGAVNEGRLFRRDAETLSLVRWTPTHRPSGPPAGRHAEPGALSSRLSDEAV